MSAPVYARRRARWRFAECDEAAARDLSRALGIQAVTARILVARGVLDAASAQRFLHPSLADLYHPHLLHGLPQAVDRIRRAIAAGEKILIYGDYDVDGTTSVVILKTAIELAGGKADFHVPHRLRDGYGMRPEVMRQAAAEGVTLIISVDTGIRAADSVMAAREVGIDVIVTDHHLPEAELPPAFAVLNPNQPGCPYPEKDLCGVGVAFKVVQALLGGLDWPQARLDRVLQSFLKLVAIGTVADVVPLTGENRIIVRHGLDGLRDVRNPGLRALLEVAGVMEGAALNAREVAFRLAPRINAAGRMATANDVIELFLTADAARARELASRLDGLNAERQQAEKDIVRLILEECESAPVTDDHCALVFAGEGWHRGVLGIVASRLVERFHRPAFVLGIEDGLAQGSGRSVAAYHLLQGLESLPGLFLKFGGHKFAAGLTLDASRVDEFRERLNGHARGLLCPDDFCPLVTADTRAELLELTPQAVDEIFALGPFGHGNPNPALTCHGVEVVSPATLMKEKHMRFLVRQNGRTVMMKGWNLGDRAAEVIPGTRLDVAFTLEEDSYSASRGYPGWAARLVDFRPA